MMRVDFKSFLLAVLFGNSIMMPAQELPVLQKDASIVTGSLPNGISFYLAPNASMKGFADFALVRKGLCDTASARSELSSLPHFNETTPGGFLSRKGIGCRPEGFISYTGESTVFRFEKVPVFERAASDTTLLLLFDLIIRQPYPHAIIIAGDFDPAQIQERMKVLSMMVPVRTPETVKEEYAWEPAEETGCSFAPSPTPSVTLDFRSRRIPRNQMNTIQPFISELFARELEQIARGRLEDSFLARNISVPELDLDWTGSADGPGDEHFKVKAVPPRDGLVPTTLAMASTLSELGSKGVGLSEFRTARAAALACLGEPEDNPALVGKCISSYLFGADLSFNRTKVKFFTSRNMPLETELSLFNDYAGALLDGSNLSVRWEGDAGEYDDWMFPVAFRSTWNGVAMLPVRTAAWKANGRDTLGLWNERRKTKLKSVSAEPVSGGQMWTFANGMKVIYKQMPTGGRFSYALMVKGGYSSVKDLAKGEGAFFSDMLSLYDVAGLSHENFSKMLKDNGIGMRCRVSVSDMRICGEAASSKFPLLLKTLLSVANDRTLNPSAFESYRRTELARLRPAFLDSLMHPDWLYSDVKTPSGLTDRTQSRADAYFANQFARMNDGVFVLAGDLPAETAQKTLARCLGGFRVSRLSTNRPALSYKFRSGTSTYSFDGDGVEIDIAMAAAIPFTTENFMAFKIAEQVLSRALAGTMAQQGFSVGATGRFTLFPQEAVELVFKCTPVPEEGLPAGVGTGSGHPMRALVAGRKALEKVLSNPVPAAELNACRSFLENSYSVFLADPGNYAQAVLMRYANGKDVLTGYGARIKSVDAARMGEVLTALSGGMRIEYVVK